MDFIATFGNCKLFAVGAAVADDVLSDSEARELLAQGSVCRSPR
ncbi:hypothetical protein SF83666_b55980 (plasmid) [Sinorhizobium fredii CCBAU 83666]|nr:hypothetical protein SF83666_b55980 [Sinorhizobium fredii CCBAU 83666]